MNAALELKNVSHEYEGLTVLDDINLQVNQGEFVSIIGPSGCGKTTLLKVAGGLLRPSRGSAYIKGEVANAALQQRQVGLVSQNPALLPWRTVEQNINLPFELAGVGGATAGELVSQVGLGGFERYYPHQLSGGMRQRVALARAFSLEPQVLLMDEPFGALDEISRTRMGFELLRVRAAHASTVLFVTHSISEAVLLADRVVVLSHRPGRIKEVIPVNLPRPRSHETQNLPEYEAALQCIRKIIYN